MLESLINGNGSMAQFNHPEFGGSGQSIKGGMTKRCAHHFPASTNRRIICHALKNSRS